jgi:hypothetical protein
LLRANLSSRGATRLKGTSNNGDFSVELIAGARGLPYAAASRTSVTSRQML